MCCSLCYNYLSFDESMDNRCVNCRHAYCDNCKDYIYKKCCFDCLFSYSYPYNNYYIGKNGINYDDKSIIIESLEKYKMEQIKAYEIYNEEMEKIENKRKKAIDVQGYDSIFSLYQYPKH